MSVPGVSAQGRGGDLGATDPSEERQVADGTACLFGQWVRAAQDGLWAPCSPTTSKELAVARGMEARLQEEPEPETEASDEAGARSRGLRELGLE